MTSADVIFGRDTELDAIRDCLEHPTAQRAVLLRGEPGIGKTTLWRAAIAVASERGIQTISTRPTESEANFSYMGLGDLLDNLAGDVLDQLPDPQRLALEVALLRAEAPPHGLDHRTVCVAVLAALRATAASVPLIVAIDDVQWLDGPTALVIEFAARRLTDEPILFISALRAAPGVDDPTKIAATLGDDAVRIIDLKGLSADSLSALLRRRLHARVPRPKLNRILEASRGNPFYALELTRALIAGRVQLDPGPLVSIPPDLSDLVPNHLAELPGSTRELLLVCAASSTPTTALLRSVSDEPKRLPSDLAGAVRAGVIEIDGERIRFTHPLLSSAVYSQAAEDRRREVHRTLAAVVADTEEHAWHVALAADGPSRDAAIELEKAADLARRRGAPGAAADLCLLAADLDPDLDAPTPRRLRLRAADLMLLGGDIERALEIADSVLVTAPRGPERAEALLRRGRALFFLQDLQGPAAQFGEASLQPDVSPVRLSTIHSWRSWAVAWHDLSQAERHATEAVRLGRASGDPSALALALGALIDARTKRGAVVAQELLNEATELESVASPFFVEDRTNMLSAIRTFYANDLDGARRLLLGLLEEANLVGDEISLADICEALAFLELAAGNWGTAIAHCERLASLWPVDPLARAYVDAHMGDTATATAAAERALRSDRGDDLGLQIGALSVLGFVALSRGDAVAANRYLRRAWEMNQRWGVDEPARSPFAADYAETLIELAEYETAATILAWLESRGRILDRPWALAAAARYRAWLVAAQGDVQMAVALIDDAVVKHLPLQMPFELARTLLVQGAIRRRAKQKRPARESLQQALEIFERLGAPLWAGKAHAELARVSGRRPVVGELTPAERRVARLAAAGRTNKEIADSLFMSARTVGGHLSHVYAKLGIRSRTELAAVGDLGDDARSHS